MCEDCPKDHLWQAVLSCFTIHCAWIGCIPLWRCLRLFRFYSNDFGRYLICLHRLEKGRQKKAAVLLLEYAPHLFWTLHKWSLPHGNFSVCQYEGAKSKWREWMSPFPLSFAQQIRPVYQDARWSKAVFLFEEGSWYSQSASGNRSQHLYRIGSTLRLHQQQPAHFSRWR